MQGIFTVLFLTAVFCVVCVPVTHGKKRPLKWKPTVQSGFTFVGRNASHSVRERVLKEVNGTTNYSINCRTTDTNVTTRLLYRKTPLSWPHEVTATRGIFIENQVYTIHGVQDSDSGFYTCRATNTLGVTIELRFFIVFYEEPRSPVITLPESIVLNATDKLVVKCTAEGSPLPRITWLKNGTNVCWRNVDKHCRVQSKVNSKNPRLRESVLTITTTSYPRDHGSFTCVAQNNVAKIEKNVDVSIQVPPKLDKTSSIFVSSPIDCRVIQGVPKPVFKWQYQFGWCLAQTYHNVHCKPAKRKWVDPPGDHVDKPGPNMASSKSELSIPKRVQFGFYRCIATNELGSDEHVIRFYRGDLY